MKFLVFASVAAVAAAGPAQLTADNFDATFEGKNGIVKFFAPWCGHCKRMKPAYDKLADEYEGSATVVIGEADCTDSGKTLCQANGVRGYPTIKYFVNGGEGEKYSSGRDYDSLKAFVAETLE